jgi:hypothetical protein
MGRCASGSVAAELSTPPAGRHESGGALDSKAWAAETPAQIHALTVVPVMALDRATIRAPAYAAALGQPAFALHISPASP